MQRHHAQSQLHCSLAYIGLKLDAECDQQVTVVINCLQHLSTFIAVAKVLSTQTDCYLVHHVEGILCHAATHWSQLSFLSSVARQIGLPSEGQWQCSASGRVTVGLALHQL